MHWTRRPKRRASQSWASVRVGATLLVLLALQMAARALSVKALATAPAA